MTDVAATMQGHAAIELVQMRQNQLQVRTTRNQSTLTVTRNQLSNHKPVISRRVTVQSMMYPHSDERVVISA
jgi:hypothetical protein